MAGNVPPFRSESLVRSGTFRFSVLDTGPSPRPSSPWQAAQLFRKIIAPSTGRIGGCRWGVVCAKAELAIEASKINFETRRSTVASGESQRSCLVHRQLEGRDTPTPLHIPYPTCNAKPNPSNSAHCVSKDENRSAAATEPFNTHSLCPRCRCGSLGQFPGMRTERFADRRYLGEPQARVAEQCTLGHAGTRRNHDKFLGTWNIVRSSSFTAKPATGRSRCHAIVHSEHTEATNIADHSCGR